MNGHIKLADFGLSKDGMKGFFLIIESTTKTKVGTIEYMAPEIIDNKDYQ